MLLPLQKNAKKESIHTDDSAWDAVQTPPHPPRPIHLGMEAQPHLQATVSRPSLRANRKTLPAKKLSAKTCTRKIKYIHLQAKKQYSEQIMKQSATKKTLTLKTLNKNNVWDLQENDIFRMMESISKDADLKDNMRHYTDIMRSAFSIEDIDEESPAITKKYEKQGFKVGQIKLDENSNVTWAVKKRPIMRVTDLTYENIHHISAAKLIEVLDRNFGGGWESLSQSIKDIIEHGFDISTTTLPKDRLHKPGGMYDKKMADGYEVLEIPKGTWVEAIFAKPKPEMEKPKLTLQTKDDDEIPEDNFNSLSDEDEEPEEPDVFNDDDITEDNYRTTFEIDGDPEEEAEGISDFDNEA